MLNKLMKLVFMLLELAYPKLANVTKNLKISMKNSTIYCMIFEKNCFK